MKNGGQSLLGLTLAFTLFSALILQIQYPVGLVTLQESTLFSEYIKQASTTQQCQSPRLQTSNTENCGTQIQPILQCNPNFLGNYIGGKGILYNKICCTKREAYCCPSNTFEQPCALNTNNTAECNNQTIQINDKTKCYQTFETINEIPTQLPKMTTDSNGNLKYEVFCCTNTQSQQNCPKQSPEGKIVTQCGKTCCVEPQTCQNGKCALPATCKNNQITCGNQCCNKPQRCYQTNCTTEETKRALTIQLFEEKNAGEYKIRFEELNENTASFHIQKKDTDPTIILIQKGQIVKANDIILEFNTIEKPEISNKCLFAGTNKEIPCNSQGCNQIICTQIMPPSLPEEKTNTLKTKEKPAEQQPKPPALPDNQETKSLPEKPPRAKITLITMESTCLTTKCEEQCPIDTIVCKNSCCMSGEKCDNGICVSIKKCGQRECTETEECIDNKCLKKCIKETTRCKDKCCEKTEECIQGKCIKKGCPELPGERKTTQCGTTCCGPNEKCQQGACKPNCQQQITGAVVATPIRAISLLTGMSTTETCPRFPDNKETKPCGQTCCTPNEECANNKCKPKCTTAKKCECTPTQKCINDVCVETCNGKLCAQGELCIQEQCQIPSETNITMNVTGWQCTEGQEKCEEQELWTCTPREIFEKRGYIQGKCNVECDPGQQKCEEIELFICNNKRTYENKGKNIEICGEPCMPETEMCEGEIFFKCNNEKKFENLGRIAGKCGIAEQISNETIISTQTACTKCGETTCKYNELCVNQTCVQGCGGKLCKTNEQCKYETCMALCGGKICERNERCENNNCESLCGEKICEKDEKCMNEKCEPLCGNKICNEREKCIENTCIGLCGDKICEKNEDCWKGQCKPLCGERVCGNSETCENNECITLCNNKKCELGETCLNSQCIPACGITVCKQNEACISKTCIEVCGKSICRIDEKCEKDQCTGGKPNTINTINITNELNITQETEIIQNYTNVINVTQLLIEIVNVTQVVNVTQIVNVTQLTNVTTVMNVTNTVNITQIKEGKVVVVEKKITVEKRVIIEKPVTVEKRVLVEKPVTITKEILVETPLTITKNKPITTFTKPLPKKLPAKKIEEQTLKEPTKNTTKPEPASNNYVYFVIILALIPAFYLLLKWRNEIKPMKEYINKTRKMGYSEEQIKQQLIKREYNKKIIENALKK
ncbi:hypothetical protein HY486_01080 [Candidatus Woesearchaeota archaeon]|nr:hypothetical protein [Candidatus Woesearchaeota archaeon]